MDNEKQRILSMLKEGLITVNEADELFEEIEKQKKKLLKKESFRYLCIRIIKKNGENVNLNIPIEMAKIIEGGSFKLSFFDDNSDYLKTIKEAILKEHVGELLDTIDEKGNRVKVWIK